MKKGIISIILLFVMAVSVPVNHVYAKQPHAHNFVLYERQLAAVVNRKCSEEPKKCTVTEYHYADVYRCRTCPETMDSSSVEKHHSYFH